MNFHRMNRREAIACLTSIGAGLAITRDARATDVGMIAAPSDELTHRASVIHQEIFFNASPKRIYSALTTPDEFDTVVHFITDIKLPNTPSQISADAGGSFLLFGGYIMGRHVELVPNKRIIQAWRTASWEAGQYSLATFELSDHAEGARLVFDQKGFPESEGEHLTAGWHSHYWEPLAKYLSR